MNKAAINKHSCVASYMDKFQISRSVITGLYAQSVFTFVRNSQNVFQNAFSTL